MAKILLNENQKLWEQIQDKLQANVKGHSSMRPALCDLRSLNIEFTCDSGETVKIETVLWFNYITCTKTNGKRGWITYDSCSKEELETILNAINLCISMEENKDGFFYGKYIRAINPWWFLSGDENTQLDSVLEESYEHYINKVMGKGGNNNMA